MVNKAINSSALRAQFRWLKFGLRVCIFLNEFLTQIGFVNGQSFTYKSFLQLLRDYTDDFFRNVLWETMDEPAPMHSILDFIRKYGYLPRKLLMRIFFFEAKKKRRYYEDVERAMNRRINRIVVRALKPNIYETSETMIALWGLPDQS
jgi:hypothetical protein